MAELLSHQAIEDQLCTEIQVILGLKPRSVQPEMRLQSLGMDSLRLVSLLIAVDKRFGINLMEAGLKREALQSVRSFAAAIFDGQPR